MKFLPFEFSVRDINRLLFHMVTPLWNDFFIFIFFLGGGVGVGGGVVVVLITFKGLRTKMIHSSTLSSFLIIFLY